jgi:U3 small nucleolar RNA-associated protein MPP10
MKQTQGVQETSEVAKLHSEAAQIFRRICIKLDALSNQNYTPLKVKEAKIRKLDASDSNATAAIRMEEVTPVAVSEAVALAPEEIYQKPRGEVRGDSEYTSEDRKKMRRDRKEKGRKEKEAKASLEREDMLRNPEKRDQLQTTTKAMESIKGSRGVTFAEGAGKHHKAGGTSGEKYSSSAFFGRLQAAQEAGTLGHNPKKRERPSSDKKAAQFKL